MKTWGLSLSIVMVCAARSTPRTTMPISSPIEPYKGPALSPPVEFDRTDAGTTKRAPPMATLARLRSLVRQVLMNDIAGRLLDGVGATFSEVRRSFRRPVGDVVQAVTFH